MGDVEAAQRMGRGLWAAGNIVVNSEAYLMI